MYFDMLNRV